MNISVKKKKDEAVKRLKMLNVTRNVIRDFNNEILNCSEFCGFLCRLDEEKKRMVAEFEQEYHAVVYHVIRQRTAYFGEMLSFLYVSDDPEEWDEDVEDIENGQTIAYVKNLTIPCSEFGSIGIESNAGGVMRTW